ncbi:hypothetical protein B0T21DRAFT_98662 [Apiosordaria backusii]|uniref:Uncharacterized protein n=1 Tax=Apiosordaria backusii TaxID=314023 RepID=A0AA40K422_9PEZI|nr:hypothetical protein B0T21DRAFT_98662 [Apiosordaria backusii]
MEIPSSLIDQETVCPNKWSRATGSAAFAPCSPVPVRSQLRALIRCHGWAGVNEVVANIVSAPLMVSSLRNLPLESSPIRSSGWLPFRPADEFGSLTLSCKY